MSLVLLTFVCPGALRADLTELFYDDFDDGDFIGWSAVHPVTGNPMTAPDIVTSPQGYSLRGVGSGYTGASETSLSQDFSVSNVGELEIEVRSK